MRHKTQKKMRERLDLIIGKEKHHIGLTFRSRGVIGEVRCSAVRFSPDYVPIPYSAVFLLHVSAPIKIGFSMVRCGLAV